MSGHQSGLYSQVCNITIIHKISCLDISQNCIDSSQSQRYLLLHFKFCSGSEDGRAFLWDRHYLCFLGHLCHSLNPEIVINGTTFCPTDDQCVVTGADDGIIHVWRSSRRHAELQRQQGLVAMDVWITYHFFSLSFYIKYMCRMKSFIDSF
jgi:WD40 repeat protein